MANKINFYTGLLNKVWNNDGTPNTNSTTGMPMEPGSLYFGVTSDNKKARIFYDVDNSNRVMIDSAHADTADTATNASKADSAKYDASGTKEITSYVASIAADGNTGLKALNANGSKVGSTINLKFLPLTGGTLTGNVTAPKFIGALQGNADTASKLKNARTISLNGIVNGSVSFDGSGDATVTTKSSTFIVGTGMTAGSWVGQFSDAGITELYDGLTIDYWINVAAASTTYLQLKDSTGTNMSSANSGKGDIVYRSSSTKLDTRYPIHNVIRLVYRKNYDISGTKYTGWWVLGDYDSTIDYQLRYYGNLKAASAVSQNYLAVGDSSGFKNLAKSVSFDINYPIVFAASAIAAAATSNNSYVIKYFAVSENQRNAASTYTLYKPIFIKGKLTNGTTFTVDSTTILTQTIPTTDDGFQYILLGYVYAKNDANNTLNIQLQLDHPVYSYKNGAFGIQVNSAEVATKATQDGSGNVIEDKYISSLSISGVTITPKMGSGNNGTAVTIPNASSSASGVVTTGAQTFAGVKTFSGGVTVSTANTFNYSGIQAASTSANADKAIWFAGSSNGIPVYSSDFTYDAKSKTLKVQNITGKVTSAVGDGNGDNIRDTYLKSVYVKDSIELRKTTGSGNDSLIGKFAPIGTDGKISLDYIPNSAIERVVTVASEAEKNALTSEDIQSGDVVHVVNATTNKMYFATVTINNNVEDITFTEFSAGIAAEVPWSGVTNKPNLLNNSTNLSISGLDIKLNRFDADGTALAENKITIPTAGASTAGVVTTGAQTLAGVKTFSGGVTVSTANTFNYSGIQSSTTNAAKPVWFAGSSNGIPVYSTNFTYNASTKTLTAENFNGTASKATGDASGNNIKTTYMKYPLTISDANVITMTNGDGDSSTITPNNKYPTEWAWTAGGANGPTASIKMKNNNTAITAISVGAIPSASGTASGIVTTGTQTFAGQKTFGNNIVISGTGDALYSRSGTSASISTDGGVAVSKQLAAKTVRIDNNQSDKGCTLTFNETYNCLEFVFA